jgi:cytochrome P450
MRAAGVIVPTEEQLINEMDGKRHTRRRRLLTTALHPRLIAGMEPYIRDLSRRLLQPMIERGGGDLVTEFAQPLPGMVIAHLFGLPEDDYPRFKAWGVEVLAGTYSTLNRTARGEGLHGAHPDFSAYIDGLIDERRVNPRADLITRMTEPDEEGDVMTGTEIRVTLFHLLVAGHETTTNLIGNLLEHLMATPRDMARIRADCSLLPAAVEESLRRDPPVVMLPKTCVHALEKDGAVVEEGERVVLSIAAANRDNRIYPEPDVFNLDRGRPAAHNAFGGGAHFCPGAPLARLEARLALEVLFDRVAALSLAKSYQRRKVQVFWANGPAHLPVTLRPRTDE